MLDLFTVFTNGGIVLWTWQDQQTSGNPINGLIQDRIIEGYEGAEDAYLYNDKQFVQYSRDNVRGLIYAAVYSKVVASQIDYLQPLLLALQKNFGKLWSGRQPSSQYKDYDFEPTFTTLYKTAQDQQHEKDRDSKMRKFEESKKFATTVEGSSVTEQAIEDRSSTDVKQAAEELTSATSEQLRKQKLEAIRARQKGSKNSNKNTPKKSNTSRVDQKPVKMDYSTEKEYTAAEVTDDDLRRYQQQAAQLGEGMSEVTYSDNEDDNSEESSSGLFSFFSSLTGSSKLTEDKLAPALEKMKNHLITKNVAADISDKLVASVRDKLVGTTASNFRGVASVVKDALSEAMTRILTPRRRVDILRDVQESQKKRQPYVIVFCGVNGVGKSTNLSKIAFWLLSNKLRVMIAACDTFRSGAVEQLKTHVTKLKRLHGQKEGEADILKLFDQGYGKDDAGVADLAIRMAKEERFDVVLVDTAGRMQDNEPLMRSLSKLIKNNQPDLVLFVGEALVGNEAVDQLTKFDRALRDFSDSSTPRTIDGIILTKFDTVDDKVGSAISMTYITRQPIVFVGTGQDYYDLKKLNVKSVVQALLK